MTEVVITGFGAITPLGTDAPSTWDAMLAGTSAPHTLDYEWAKELPVTFAAEGGQLQLNAFEPVIAFNILESTRVMTRAMRTLSERCIAGITANTEVLDDYVRHSIGLVTALVPVLGYAASTEVAAEALRTGRPVADLVLERGLLDRAHLDTLLSPEMMTTPHRPTATGSIPSLDGATQDG